MGRLALIVLLALSIPARAQSRGIGALGGAGRVTPPEPPTVASEEVVAALAKELLATAGKGWELYRDRDTITLSRSIRMLPMGAFSAADMETHTYRIVVTLSPFLEAAAQRATREAATKKERTRWGTVARLVCEEKSFDDHYEDGLCFRAKTDAAERKVAAYRAARAALAAVPTLHRANAFAVAVRRDEPQLTAGRCQECVAAAERIAAVFTPYP